MVSTFSMRNRFHGFLILAGLFILSLGGHHHVEAPVFCIATHTTNRRSR